MKKILAVASIGVLAIVGIAMAASSITTPTCTLTASPATMPLGVQTPVTATWTTSGATSVSVVYQYTGGTGPVTVYSTSTPNGTVTAPILGSLTNWVIVTASSYNAQTVCKAIIYGTSSHQPN